MTEDRSPTADAYADALRALDAASTYGYDRSAAYQAVLAHLGDLDTAQLRELVGAMAVLSVWYARLETLAWRYRTKIDYDAWVSYARSRMAIEGRP